MGKMGPRVTREGKKKLLQREKQIEERWICWGTSPQLGIRIAAAGEDVM